MTSQIYPSVNTRIQTASIFLIHSVIARKAMTESEKTEFLRKLRIGKTRGGHLESWGTHYFFNGSYCGIITDDPNGRFKDGDIVTTSPCVKIHNIDNVKILETEQSYYTLGVEGTYDDREHYKKSGDENE